MKPNISRYVLQKIDRRDIVWCSVDSMIHYYFCKLINHAPTYDYYRDLPAFASKYPEAAESLLPLHIMAYLTE